jgi:hypothetical protein
MNFVYGGEGANYDGDDDNDPSDYRYVPQFCDEFLVKRVWLVVLLFLFGTLFFTSSLILNSSSKSAHQFLPLICSHSQKE